HRQGEDSQKPGAGFHIYNAVTDASDIPRFGRVLFKRLWLADYGYIAISRAGTFQVRSIIDASIYSPEKLDFVGRPVVGDGLVYSNFKVGYKSKSGGYLDTRMLPDLSMDEEWK